jgi:hypothetical protein
MSSNTVSLQPTSEPLTDTVKKIGSFRDDYQSPDRRRIELILAPTGPFRPVVEEYLSTAAANKYAPTLLTHVRGSLGKFFRFAAESEGLETLNQNRPSTITRFIESERQRGVRYLNNTIGHLSTFFDWAVCGHHCDCGNPVVSGMHRRLLWPSEENNNSHEDLILAPTGPFRPVIEKYMMTAAADYYAPELFNPVRESLGKFFRFAVGSEGIETLVQVRPSTITRFIEADRQRGVRNPLIVGHLSTFFDWVICDQRCDFGNPVIPSMHRQLLKRSVENAVSLQERNTDSNVQ